MATINYHDGSSFVPVGIQDNDLSDYASKTFVAAADVQVLADAAQAGDAAYLSLNAAGVGATQPLISKVLQDQSVKILVVGDSTGDSTSEWPYLLATTLGGRFPTHDARYRAWSDGSSAYGSPTTISSGTGSQVIDVYNGSVAGKNGWYVVKNLADMVEAVAPDLVIVSHGHNYSSDVGDTFRGGYCSLVDALAALLPTTPLLLTAQNPHTTGTLMQERADIIRDVAATRGYGVVDVMAAFIDYGNWSADLMADSVHPDADGQAVWAGLVADLFRYVEGAQGLQRPAPGLLSQVDNLARNGTFEHFFSSDTVPVGWVANNAAITLDTVNYETGEHSCRITGTGAGASFMYQDVLTATTVLSMRGRYVTAAVRMKKITGTTTTTVGRVRVEDGVDATESVEFTEDGSGWHWVIVTHKISTTATLLRVRVWSDSATSTNAVAVDRYVVVPGMVPGDVRKWNGPLDTRGMRLRYKEATAGTALVQATDTARQGLAFLEGATLPSNAKTEYRVMVSAYGVEVKKETDTYARILLHKDGSIWLGDGTFEPLNNGPKVFGTSTSIRFDKVHFYFDTDNTYDVGLSTGKRPRTIYAATDLVAGAKVKATGGLGVGNSAAATTLGTLSKKMEVFDASGASIGFVPIYTTIT